MPVGDTGENVYEVVREPVSPVSDMLAERWAQGQVNIPMATIIPIPDDIPVEPEVIPNNNVNKLKKCLIIISVSSIVLFCAAGAGIGLYEKFGPDETNDDAKGTAYLDLVNSTATWHSLASSTATETSGIPISHSSTTNPTTHKETSTQRIVTSQQSSALSQTTGNETHEIPNFYPLDPSSSTTGSPYTDAPRQTTETSTYEIQGSQQPNAPNIITEATTNGKPTSQQPSVLSTTSGNVTHRIPTFQLPDHPTSTTEISTSNSPGTATSSLTEETESTSNIADPKSTSTTTDTPHQPISPVVSIAVSAVAHGSSSHSE